MLGSSSFSSNVPQDDLPRVPTEDSSNDSVDKSGVSEREGLDTLGMFEPRRESQLSHLSYGPRSSTLLGR